MRNSHSWWFKGKHTHWDWHFSLRTNWYAFISTKDSLRSCENVELNLNVITLLNQINWLLLLNEQIMIAVYSLNIIKIKSLQELLIDWDLLFKLKCKLANTYIYTLIVNCTLTSIKICNDFSKTLIIPHHTSLNCIVKYETDSCFLVSADLLWADSLKFTNWIKLTF